MFIGLCLLGIPQQLGTGQISPLITFPTGYFVFKNENVKVKVKYSFVLRTGLAGLHLVWAYYMFFHSYSFKNDFFTFSHRDLYQTYMSCSGI